MDTFEEKGAPCITVDTVGAGEGEIVMWAGGSSSRQTDLTTNKPVDSSIAVSYTHLDVYKRQVHASIDGMVTAVDARGVEITGGESA